MARKSLAAPTWATAEKIALTLPEVEAGLSWGIAGAQDSRHDVRLRSDEQRGRKEFDRGRRQVDQGVGTISPYCLSASRANWKVHCAGDYAALQFN
jgi:hypothetical protein